LLLLANDRVGLILMFAMPLILVVIVTAIQDSAFKMINNKAINMLVSNDDDGKQGAELIALLNSSNMFNITETKGLDSSALKQAILEDNVLTAIYIGRDFSAKLSARAESVSSAILADFGLGNEDGDVVAVALPELIFLHDPVLQENYCYSIMNILFAHLKNIESKNIIGAFYLEMNIDSKEKDLFGSNSEPVPIKRISATRSGKSKMPNSTQHNVPAWTVFAMFFMVVSLGANIVKERTLGSFLRLKTMPSSFAVVVASKQLVYIGVALLQVIFIFSVGIFVFPVLGLPPLVLPGVASGLLFMTFMSALAAVSYAVLIGSLAQTHEQANGVGAVSIIIFAALGGIWVPAFAMPDYMQVAGSFSPLYWCLEGFYAVFLRQSDWEELTKIASILATFAIVCQGVSIVKMRTDRLL